jgi:hypothetical protein
MCGVCLAAVCPPGYYSNTGQQCDVCPPGSFCPGGKDAAVTSCGVNKFSTAGAKDAGECVCVAGE